MSHFIQPRDFVESFAAHLLRDTAAAFVGAGLSQGAGYPSWTRFIDDLKLPIPHDDDPLRRAQYAAIVASEQHIRDAIVRTFGTQRAPTSAHRELAKLRLSRVWTTNYDTLLEQSFDEASIVCDLKYANQDLGRLPRPGRDLVLYKMHGDWRSPEKAVLTQDDFQTYEKLRPGFLSTLESELYSRSFLFLGTGFRDPNLELVLGRLRRDLHRPQHDHFLIRPAPEHDKEKVFDLEAQYLARYRVRTVTIENWSALPALLREVAETTDMFERRSTVFLSGAVDPPDDLADKIVGVAIALTERIIAEGLRVLNGYGTGIGHHIMATALRQPKRTRRQRGLLERVNVIPFPPGTSWGSPEHDAHAREIVRHAGFAVFVGGSAKTRGVVNEFEMARAEGIFPIPIGATGNQAKELWDRMRADLGQYYGDATADVEPHFAALNDPKRSAEELADAAVRIVMALRPRTLP